MPTIHERAESARAFADAWDNAFAFGADYYDAMSEAADRLADALGVPHCTDDQEWGADLTRMFEGQSDEDVVAIARTAYRQVMAHQ